MAGKQSKLFVLLLFLFAGSLNAMSGGIQSEGGFSFQKSEIEIADNILDHVLALYDVPEHGLLSETYPVNPDHSVDYLAEGSVQRQRQEVAFLWPFSGVLSGAVALHAHTGERKYLEILEKRLLPGLEKYHDASRLPAGYQSYPTFAGHSDRFYDDNVWLALDFCKLYGSTENQGYLNKAVEIFDFIYSGWDDNLGGGIYWCEQNRNSKNTCSNAPGAVLAAKLYLLTDDGKYLQHAVDTYHWTKVNLLDPEDHVYWDNISLQGTADKRKYSYNSGQMVEAGVLLYQITGDETYLADAKKTASGSFSFFTKIVETPNGQQRFYSDSPWFNTVMLRGLKALHAVDGNDEYIATMRSNIHYAWDNLRDSNGLLGNSWHTRSDNPYKWLLDNACLIELFAELNGVKQ